MCDKNLQFVCGFVTWYTPLTSQQGGGGTVKTSNTLPVKGFNFIQFIITGRTHTENIENICRLIDFQNKSDFLPVFVFDINYRIR